MPALRYSVHFWADLLRRFACRELVIEPCDDRATNQTVKKSPYEANQAAERRNRVTTVQPADERESAPSEPKQF